MPTHRSKLKKFSNVHMPNEVTKIVTDAELILLVDCSLTILDASLLSTFVERWHKERSSFHLPFGEMDITLDDVSIRFHLLLIGNFFTAPINSEEIASLSIGQFLGVTPALVLDEFRALLENIPSVT